MNIRIRTAVLQDRERIIPLQQEIARLHHEGRPDLMKNEARLFTEEAFRTRLEDPDHTVLIAETEDGTVAGYAFAWVISFRNHSTYLDFDCFYIDDICVVESHRRMGIGKALFNACKERAKDQGCKIMDLGVWSFNRDAIAFYQSCGMTERTRKMELKLED